MCQPKCRLPIPSIGRACQILVVVSVVVDTINGLCASFLADKTLMVSSGIEIRVNTSRKYVLAGNLACLKAHLRFKDFAIFREVFV